jgi:hypothetical protein
MKVIIAGSRTFSDYKMLVEACDALLQREAEVIVLSGKASGADTLGERYARERGYAVEEHPAEWERHGRKAGYLRNRDMAEAADALIAFWDGNSTGTRMMISLAKAQGLKTKVCRYTK